MQQLALPDLDRALAQTDHALAQTDHALAQTDRNAPPHAHGRRRCRQATRPPE